MTLFKSIHEVMNTVPYTCNLRYLQKGRERTLDELKEHCALLVKTLQQLPYTSFALCLDDTFNFTCALLACLYAGKVPVLPGHKVKNLLLAEVQNEKRYDCLLLEEDCPEFAGIPTLNLNKLDTREPLSLSCFDQPPAAESPIIMYTSGSTGESKRIPKPLYCMEREGVMLQKLLKDSLSSELKVAGTVYPWHLYGLTFRIFFPLLAGLKQECALLHFTEELCAQREPLMLITSPAFVSRLDYKLKAPSIKLTVSAGGKLNSEAAASYYRWSGCAFNEIYGSTETGVMATRLYRGEDLPWHPFPEVSLEQRDDAVYLHSPLLAQNEFKLDDLLSFDAQGSFTILGRRDRTVKIEEQRVSLTKLEAEFCSLPQIQECAIVVLQEGGKTYLGAVIKVSAETLKEIENLGTATFKKQLRQKLLAHVEGTVLPKKLRIVTEMPSNHMGKRPVAKLKELFTHADAQ